MEPPEAALILGRDHVITSIETREASVVSHVAVIPCARGICAVLLCCARARGGGVSRDAAVTTLKDDDAIVRTASSTTTVSMASTDSGCSELHGAPLGVVAAPAARSVGNSGGAATVEGGGGTHDYSEPASAAGASARTALGSPNGVILVSRVRLGARALGEPMTALGAAAHMLGPADGVHDCSMVDVQREVASEDLYKLQLRGVMGELAVDCAIVHPFNGGVTPQTAPVGGVMASDEDVAAILDTSCDDDAESCGCSCCSASEAELDERVSFESFNDGVELPRSRASLAPLLVDELNAQSEPGARCSARARVYKPVVQVCARSP